MNKLDNAIGRQTAIPEPVIVFDTDCVLCSGMVAFVLAHEQDHELHFLGAWSDEGLALAAKHGYSRADLNRTFLVIEAGEALNKSDAVIAIAAHLRAPWRWAKILRLCPRPLRDHAYSFVARHRYRWFGHHKNCTLIPPEARHRFIGV